MRDRKREREKEREKEGERYREKVREEELKGNGRNTDSQLQKRTN